MNELVFILWKVKQRPRNGKYNIFNKPEWTCSDCLRSIEICAMCNAKATHTNPSHACYNADGQFICTVCRFPPCDVCKARHFATSSFTRVQRKLAV